MQVQVPAFFCCGQKKHISCMGGDVDITGLFVFRVSDAGFLVVATEES